VWPTKDLSSPPPTLVEWRKWRYTTVCVLHGNIRSPPSNISAKGSRSSSSFISFYLFFRSMVVVVLAYNGTLRENVKVGCFRAPDNPISFFLLFLRWFKKNRNGNRIYMWLFCVFTLYYSASSYLFNQQIKFRQRKLVIFFHFKRSWN
jgi:hypothetical protein